MIGSFEFKKMPIESEPQLRKKVFLPEVGIETELPEKFDYVFRGEVPSLYERTREIRGLGSTRHKDAIVFDTPKEASLESDHFLLKAIQLAERIRISINRKLNDAMDALEDHLDPFSDADSNTAHGFMHKGPDGRTLYEISYREGLDSNMKLFAIGHEYGELLQNISNQKDLQIALDAEKLSIHADQYFGEDFADLAGFLALRRAKLAGDDSIRIPFFVGNARNREKMGRLFGLEPSIGPTRKPMGL